MKLTTFQKEILKMLFLGVLASQIYYCFVDKQTEYIYVYIAIAIGLLRGIIYILEKYDIDESDY